MEITWWKVLIVLALLALAALAVEQYWKRGPVAFSDVTGAVTSAAPAFPVPDALDTVSTASYLMEQVEKHDQAGYAFYTPYFQDAFVKDGLVWPSQLSPEFNQGMDPVMDRMRTAQQAWTPKYGPEALVVASAASYTYGGRQLK